MRRLTVLGLLLTLAGIVGAAQLTSAQSPDQSPTRKPSQPAAPRTERERQAPEKSAQKSSENNAPAQEVRAGTRVQATLETALDAGTAQPGDEVRARVTKDVKQDGQVVIHKGDQLAGHVTSVQAAGNGEGASQVAVTFDRLLQGEASSELNAVVTSVVSTPSEDRARRDEMMKDEPMPGPAPAGGSRPARQSSGSPGLVGSVTSTVGSTANAAGSTVGGAGGAVGSTTRSTLGGTAAAGLSTPLRALQVESAGQAEHASGVNSVFSTGDGQLRLESGTRLQLQVVGEAAATSANPSNK